LPAQGIRFREFRPEDIPALVDIRDCMTPDAPARCSLLSTLTGALQWEKVMRIIHD
jgi:hypothetical protein